MIKFHPLQEKHFPLLLHWLESPHIKAWWDQDVHWTMDLIKEKYGCYVKEFKRLTLPDKTIEKPMYAFIMCVDGVEVGYIQYYDAYDFPREQGYELEGLPSSLASIDVFIGEEDFVGKGLGPLLMETFLNEHVFKHFDAVFVDPDTANLHAIRAYEKAGFKKIKTINEGAITWMMKTSPRNN
ncbi:MAG: GNAT family N-acetyltransferase [Proteobacteria bacterium]|nr:GNAT family N-acetyltransferase [Pseudomonadota bacterium]